MLALIKEIKNKWQKFYLIIFLIVFSIFLSLFFLFFLQAYSKTSFSELNTNQIIDTDKTEKTENLLANPVARERYLSLPIENNQPNKINVTFKDKVELNGISFYFPGDLSNQTTYGARRITISYVDDDGALDLFKQENNNKQPFYEFYSQNEISTDNLEISFSGPFFYESANNGEVRINDLKLYRKSNLGIYSRIKDTFKRMNQFVLLYTVYYIIFLFFLFAPGYVFFSYLVSKIKANYDKELIIIISPIFGLTAMFLLALIFLVTGMRIALYIYPFFVLYALIEIIRKKQYKDFIQNSSPLILMGLALLIILLVIARKDYIYNLQYIGSFLDSQSQIPIDGYPGYFVDNLFPWRIGRFYLHRLSLNDPLALNLLNETTLYDRTPLFPLINTVILNLFGEARFVFQRFLEVLSVLFFASFYYLIRKYYSKEVASVSSFVVLLNVPIFFTVTNVEIYYKFFSIYPIFIAFIIFLLDIKYANYIIGFLLALAFLIHPSTLIFSIALLSIFVIKLGINKKLLINIYPSLSMLFVVFISWILIPIIINKGSISTSDHSFYLSEIVKIDGSLFTAKITNFLALLIPNHNFITEKFNNVFNSSYLSSYPFFRYSFISNLSPLFFLILLVYLFRYFKKDRNLIMMGLLPLMVFWLFYLNQLNFFSYYGGAYFILYPFVIPLCLAFLTNYLLKGHVLVRLIMFSTYIVFMLYQLFYSSGVFTKIRYSPINKLNLLIVLVYFCLLSAVLIWKVVKFEKETNRETNSRYS